jgi:hypothetical protein
MCWTGPRKGKRTIEGLSLHRYAALQIRKAIIYGFILPTPTAVYTGELYLSGSACSVMRSDFILVR